MATLTGRAALDYMMQNPGAGRVTSDPGGISQQFQMQPGMGMGGQQPGMGMMPQQQQRPGILGTLGNIGKSLWQNVVQKPAGQLFEGIGYGLGKGISGLTGGQAGLAPGTSFQDYLSQTGGMRGMMGDVGLGGLAKPFTLGEDQQQAFAERPGFEGLKSAANIGSMILPGAAAGKGLGSFLGAGAVSGGLGGFGQAERPEDILGSTLKGAGMGALAGGAGYGIGKGLQKLAGGADEAAAAAGMAGKGKGKLAGKLQRRVFKGVTEKGTGLTPELLEQTQTQILDDFIGMGMPVNTVDDVANNLPGLIQKYTDDVDNLAASSPMIQGAKRDIFKTAGFYDDAGVFKPEIVRKLNTDDFADIRRMLNGMGDDVGASQLVDLNRLLTRKAGGYKGITTASGAAKRQFLQGLRKASRDAISTKAPRLSEILTRQNRIMDVGDEILGAVGKQTGVRGYGLSMNLRRPMEQVTSRVGRGMQGMGGGGGKIAQGIGKAAGVAGQGLQAVSPYLPGIAGQMGGQQGMAPQGQTMGPQDQYGTEAPQMGMGAGMGQMGAPGDQQMGMGGGMPQQMGMGGQQPGQYEQRMAQMQLEALQMGVDPKFAANLAEQTLRAQGMMPTEELMSYQQQAQSMQGGGMAPAKLSEKEKTFQSAGQQAQQALGLLESGRAQTGMGRGGILGNVGQKLGLTSDDQVAYRSAISLANTALKNAFLGGSMSEQELASLASSIPEFNDPPNVARQKLMSFIQMTQQYGNLGQGQQQGMGGGMQSQQGAGMQQGMGMY